MLQLAMLKWVKARGGQIGRLQISQCLSGPTVDNMTNDYITKSGAKIGV